MVISCIDLRRTHFKLCKSGIVVIDDCFSGHYSDNNIVSFLPFLLSLYVVNLRGRELFTDEAGAKLAFKNLINTKLQQLLLLVVLIKFQ